MFLPKPATASAARLFRRVFLLCSLLTRHFSLLSPPPFSPQPPFPRPGSPPALSTAFSPKSNSYQLMNLPTMPMSRRAGTLFAVVVAATALGVAHSQGGPGQGASRVHFLTNSPKRTGLICPTGPQSPETDELLIFLQPDQSAAAFAAANRLTLKFKLRSDGHAHVFSAPSAAAATGLLKALSKNPACTVGVS